jgi:hypothetical protein
MDTAKMIMSIINNEHIRNLTQILQYIGENIEGNLICDKRPDNYIIDENIEKIHNIQYLAKNKKKIIEIGINACHSLLLMLMVNPDAEYLLFDLNEHKYTNFCVNYIKDAFPNTKIHVIYGNSVETIYNYILHNSHELNTFDLCHLDGGHSENVFSNDFINVKNLIKKDGCVIFDDYNFPEIHNYINSNVDNNIIVELNDINVMKTDKHFVYKYV